MIIFLIYWYCQRAYLSARMQKKTSQILFGLFWVWLRTNFFCKALYIMTSGYVVRLLT